LKGEGDMNVWLCCCGVRFLAVVVLVGAVVWFGFLELSDFLGFDDEDEEGQAKLFGVAWRLGLFALVVAVPTWAIGELGALVALFR